MLAHKLREALAVEMAELMLSNTIEVDGAYFGGHARQANFKADLVDQCLLQNRTDKRRVVVALRERARERIAEGSVVAALAPQCRSNRSTPAADRAISAFDTRWKARRAAGPLNNSRQRNTRAGGLSNLKNCIKEIAEARVRYG